MNTTSVFSKNAIAFADGFRYIVNQGGTSSSKTFSILQLIHFIASSNDNLLISVVAESMPHLKRGAMRDFFKIMTNENLYQRESHNKTDNTYRVNKSIIEFFSADNEAKVRGARRDILFLNECNNIDFDTADQLLIRTKIATFFDFNPVSSFWVHENILSDNQTANRVAFIKSTFRDNEHLDKRIRDEIESRRTNPRFANWFRVYGEGEVGTLEGLVIPDFKIVDQIPDTVSTIGIDFGFTNDPTAIIDTREQNGELYLDEIEYRTGMTNGDIFKIVSPFALSKRTTVVADSSEPKSIKELSDRGLNIHGALKGAGSVNAGIDILRQFASINVTRRSVNLIRELRNYTFAVDRSGKTTNEPIDIFNHAIDAARYAVSFRRLSAARKLTGAKFNF